MTSEEHVKNNLADLLTRWEARALEERRRPNSAQSFCVSKVDLAANKYDLSLSQYKEIKHDEIEHSTPEAIISDLRVLEAEISEGLSRLEGILQ